MRVASAEWIKGLAWRGKELAQRQSRLVTQAWVTCGCCNIKIDWFGLQVRCIVSVIQYCETIGPPGRRNWDDLTLFISLFMLIQSIDPNWNNLSLSKPACGFYAPYLRVFFSTFPRCPLSSNWSLAATGDGGGISHVCSTGASCKIFYPATATGSTHKNNNKAIGQHRSTQSVSCSLANPFINLPNRRLRRYLVVITALPSIWGLKRKRVRGTRSGRS